MKKIFLILFFLAGNVHSEGYATLGGNIDCGEWLDARKNKVSKQYEHYLLGLVDGLALGRLVDIWSGKNGRITQVQFYYWMDSYCRRKPLDMTVTGAFAFANEMSNGSFNKAVEK